jgi:cell division protein FtsI (penicillin-binding protein 3)
VAVSVPANNARQRLYLLAALLVFWFGLICLRLVQLQIFDYGDFVTRASHQQQRTIEISPRRGVIYDRHGQELAMSIAVDSFFAVPSEIPDQPTAAGLLARVLNVDPHDLLARFRSSRTFCWVARKVDAQTSKRIHDLNLRGIYSQKESKRFYPNRELGAQVLGYVGLDDEGLSGIERQYDERLRGKPGEMLLSVDAKKQRFSSAEHQPVPGENVVLTIDQKIQYIAEHELDAAMQETHAVSGTVIVENPHTGEILALANRPTFNPNRTRDISTEMLKNHAVSDVFEPGSTFKIITLSAALDQKLTRPEEVVDCQMGSIVIGGMRIRDHKPFGLLTVSEILAHSSDVGAIKVGLRLGDDRLYQYVRAYGFGSQTGIELPGETRGLTKPVSRWSKVSIGAISMGQEIGISPIQLAAMVSTIANDGVWTAPRIVAATTEAHKTPQTVMFHPAQQRRVVTPLTAAEMKKMMEGVVLFGTGRKAQLEGYTSAGKTGTAQKVDPATGAYSHTKYVASFAGFAPVNNPAITVAVILDSAVGLHQGGQVSAPVFQRVAQQVLAYLNVPHDVELPPNRTLLMAGKKNVREDDLSESSPDHLGANLDIVEENIAPATPVTNAGAPADAIELARNADRHPTLKPASEDVASFVPQTSAMPVASSAAVPSMPAHPMSGTVVLDAEQGGIVVPSFVGKPLRLAVESAQDSGLELDVVGDGIARDQQPPPGSHVAPGAHVIVRFER